MFVDFRAVADFGRGQGGAVDAAICADLDVAADADRTQLRKLLMALVVKFKAESVGAEHATGVEDHAVPDGDFVVDDDAWIDPAIGADDGTASDGDACFDDSVVTDRTSSAMLA